MKCYRCHVDNEEYHFRIFNQVFCYECYMFLLGRIETLLEVERKLRHKYSGDELE